MLYVMDRRVLQLITIVNMWFSWGLNIRIYVLT